jgi:hypothetical protein
MSNHKSDPAAEGFRVLFSPTDAQATEHFFKKKRPSELKLPPAVAARRVSPSMSTKQRQYLLPPVPESDTKHPVAQTSPGDAKSKPSPAFNAKKSTIAMKRAQSLGEWKKERIHYNLDASLRRQSSPVLSVPPTRPRQVSVAVSPVASRGTLEVSDSKGRVVYTETFENGTLEV